MTNSQLETVDGLSALKGKNEHNDSQIGNINLKKNGEKNTMTLLHTKFNRKKWKQQKETTVTETKKPQFSVFIFHEGLQETKDEIKRNGKRASEKLSKK